MTAAAQPRVRSSSAVLWTGRALSAVGALFMAMDAIMHLVRPAPVATSFAQLQLPLGMSVPIGVIALVCTALYAIPRTAVIGAVLLTGYLGGAIAIQLRAGSAPFPTFFPLIIAALLWGGLWLRDERARGIVRG